MKILYLILSVIFSLQAFALEPIAPDQKYHFNSRNMDDTPNFSALCTSLMSSMDPATAFVNSTYVFPSENSVSVDCKYQKLCPGSTAMCTSGVNGILGTKILTCPSHSSSPTNPVSSCNCDEGYRADQTTVPPSCVPACTAGQRITQYIPETQSPSTICSAGCSAGIVSATNGWVTNSAIGDIPAGTAVILGTWETDGESCTGSNSGAPVPPSGDTPESCAAQGMGYATDGSTTVCAGTDPGVDIGDSVSEVPADPPVDCVAEPNFCQQQCDLDPQFCADHGMNPDGTPIDGTGGSVDCTVTPSDPSCFTPPVDCSVTPSDPSCSAPPVDCSVTPSDPSCSAPPPDPVTCNPLTETCSSTVTFPSVQNWYEKKYPEGLTGVFQTNMVGMKSTPLGQTIQSFNISVGAVTNGCFTFPILSGGSNQLCIPEGVLNFLGIIMMLTAVFTARAIIFGG